jgi:hypothetical protein
MTATTSTTLMETLGWEHGRRRHQAHPLPGQWGDDGEIAMMMAGRGLGLGFGGDALDNNLLLPPPLRGGGV